MGAGPTFSFYETAVIEAPAPMRYEQAREEMVQIEKRMGAEYYQHNAKLAHQFWQRKKPWWL